MKLRAALIAAVTALSVLGIASPASACDPSNNDPCDIKPNDDLQYVYCKLSPTC